MRSAVCDERHDGELEVGREVELVKPGNYCVLLATLVLTFILEGWYGWFFGGKDTN